LPAVGDGLPNCGCATATDANMRAPPRTRDPCSLRMCSCACPSRSKMPQTSYQDDARAIF
jgi:hypothetical protein